MSTTRTAPARGGPATPATPTSAAPRDAGVGSDAVPERRPAELREWPAEFEAARSRPLATSPPIRLHSTPTSPSSTTLGSGPSTPWPTYSAMVRAPPHRCRSGMAGTLPATQLVRAAARSPRCRCSSASPRLPKTYDRRASPPRSRRRPGRGVGRASGSRRRPRAPADPGADLSSRSPTIAAAARGRPPRARILAERTEAEESAAARTSFSCATVLRPRSRVRSGRHRDLLRRLGASGRCRRHSRCCHPDDIDRQQRAANRATGSGSRCPDSWSLPTTTGLQLRRSIPNKAHLAEPAAARLEDLLAQERASSPTASFAVPFWWSRTGFTSTNSAEMTLPVSASISMARWASR